MKNLTKKVLALWSKTDLETKVNFLRRVKCIDISKGYSITSKDKIDYYNYINAIYSKKNLP